MAKVSAITTKRAAVSAKGECVSLCAEITGRLWEVFPPTFGENKKGWRDRVARELTATARAAGYKDVRITARRVRAYANGEARRIDHIEVKLIELREKLNQREERVPTRQERVHDIRAGYAALRTDQGSGDRSSDRGAHGTPLGRSLGGRSGCGREGEWSTTAPQADAGED